MALHEAEMGDLSGARCFSKPDLLHEYWYVPLAPKTQDLFTFVNPDELYTPSCVTQEASNEVSYFQGTLTRLLRGLKSKIWGGYMFLYDKGPEE